jgi:heavy metal sensor kinase
MNNLFPRTFRLRLTLWYVGFFSVLFVLVAVLVHSVFDRALENRLDEALSVEANTEASMLQDEFTEENGDIRRAASQSIADLRPGASIVGVLAGEHLLASSAPIAPEQLQSITANAISKPGVDAAFPVAAAKGVGARVSLRTVEVGGKPYVVLAMQSMDEVGADLAVLRRVFLLSFPMILLAAGLGGYWVARRSLAPLGWMAEQSRRISESNLHSRLEIGTAADELASLAASFNELLSRLELSFGTIRRFVADASHELRTPLSIIRGEADVALSQDRSPAEYRAALTTIQDESRRLSRLVDDLLNLARADAGRVKLQIEDFYLNDVISECCRSAQKLAAVRQITVECKCPEGDAPFRGDEELLRRLVMNLLDNAVRYTPAGGKVTARLEASGAQLRFQVSDTGVGIAPEVAPLVFDRFYRADMARSREDGGFGLGLSIVKWIAESHNGAVELASAPGAGSTFTVTLPR